MVARRIYHAVGLVSCSLILLQISFTRLIGYKLFYHFVFLAIALSLLGLGAAGTFVAVRRRPENLDRTFMRWLAALVLVVPICFLLIANPFLNDPGGNLVVKLVGDDAMDYLVWCSVLMVIPNFVGGVVLTYAFSEYSRHMGALYARDLVGAGIGCLLCVALMKYFSPPTAFVTAGLVAAPAVVEFYLAAGEKGARKIPLGVTMVGLALVALVLAGPSSLRDFQSFQTPRGRDIEILKYEWNHILRVDHTPGRYLLDGEAATPVTVWKPNQWIRLTNDPVYVLGPEKPQVAVIGFGGGAQVAEARNANAESIYGIDINPTISRWVVGEDRALNGDLFMAPNIQLVTGEGRHEVRSAGKKFDVIVMHGVDTYAATASGAYALTENFLYTKEAILDYLRALSPQGVMSVQRWLFNPPRENMKLFVTALDALAEFGIAEPERHIAMVAPISSFEMLKVRDTRVFGYLLFSPTPFSEQKLGDLRAHVARRRWVTLYAPGVEEDTPFSQYVHAPNRKAFLASYPYLIKPVTDAQPYLFQFYDPLHQSTYEAHEDWALSDLYQSSAVLLLVALGLAVGLSTVTILLPLVWDLVRARRRTGKKVKPLPLRHVVFFSCLGVGFMALEVPMTQVLALYLGHPTYGFSVVLVALLLSTGIGSLLVDKIAVSRVRVCVVIAALLCVATLAIFPFVHATIQWPDTARFSVALILVAACGLPMGFPLAQGVKELGRSSQRDVAWAWGVNAFASVVGSCVVMVVMVLLGTGTALWLGVGCYAVAALASWGARAGEPKPTPAAERSS